MGFALDIAFLLALFLIVPLYARRRKHRLSESSNLHSANKKNPAATINRTSIIAGLLLALLAAAWIVNGRGFNDLGLGLPDQRGWTGVLLVMVVPFIFVWMARAKPASDDEKREAIEGHFPETMDAFLRLIPGLVFVSAAWEILYRGAVMYYLTPYLGVVLSMIAAAGLYTIAHGAKNRKAYGMTFLAAFFFVAFFVLSGSLWGPILLHCLIPVLSAYLLLSGAAGSRPS